MEIGGGDERRWTRRKEIEENERREMKIDGGEENRWKR